MNAFFSFDLFMVYIPECKQQIRTNTFRHEIVHPLNLILLLSESCAIINDLEVILHGCMLQIIYITVFPVKQLNNLALSIV